ncbi:Smr/MutS family protein [Sphingomonas sp. MMS24-J13]|uniref:Smr/MutS family protein n=1 Tax=Sphingomonas sp. MMS24-J13 TaxID=3238686 RepID=UPI00384F639E
MTPLAGREAVSPLDRLPAEGSVLLKQESAPIVRDPALRWGDVKKVKAAAPPADTLDGGWDRRLRRGMVLPDRTIDLHGHTLATAHDALDHALARAVADEVRVLLVVTGKPRPDDRKRGLIRANIGNWIAHSGHSSRIAAVRNAHPRHGGAGALYLIFRRKRDG